MATSRAFIDTIDTVGTRVGSWLEGTDMRLYAVSPSPVPASEASNWPVVRSDRHTAVGDVSPGPSEYWKKSTIASDTQDARSNPETSSHPDNRTLVQIVGQHAEQVAQSRPTPDSIYIGPKPLIRFDYPPHRDSATCFVVTGSGFKRLYRWDLQADDFVTLPDGTTRPLDLQDQCLVTAAVVDSQLSQLGPDSHFLQGNMRSLNEGLFESLDEIYRRPLRYDLNDEFDITTQIDDNTHEHVVIATSRYHDVQGTRFTAAIRFRCPPSAT